MITHIQVLARFSRPLLGAFCFVAVQGFAVVQARADYRVQHGDSVEVSIVGLPDLRKRAIVSIDGQLALPLIGEVQAAGSTLPELRKRVRELYRIQALRNRAGGQLASGEIILESEVSLDIVEYRPVYVTGGVSSPGVQAFRPGLTVRQAVATAGGYGASVAGATAARVKLAALEGQLAAAALEHDRESARLARIEAELVGLADEALGDSALFVATEPENIGSTESQLQSIRIADQKVERDTLQRALVQAQARVNRLERQFANEQKGADSDEIELEKLEGLVARGLVTNTRVIEARRFVLLSSTRALQTGTQMDYAKREVEDLRARLERLTPLRQITLLGQLQDTRVRVGGLRASLDSLAQQKALVDPASASGGEIALTVTRIGKDGSVTRSADEDEPLQPGDVVTAQHAAARPTASLNR